jgi:hypothetical protein
MPKTNIFSKVVQATRVQKKCNILLTGPTNAGKTLSSLLLAKGLTNSGKVLVIDSENGRSSLQVQDPHLGSDGWTWDVIYLDPEEMTSELLTDVIKGASTQGYECVVLDSITFEWTYIKELHQKLGGKFTDWGKAKKPHRDFVRAVLGADIHVIMTMRSKMEYVQNVTDSGKKQVSKLGLAPEGESTFPYEVDFHFEVNEEHYARMGKTAQGLLTQPEVFFITEEHGHMLRRFSEEGEGPQDRTKRVYISRLRELASEQDNLPPEEELMLLSLEDIAKIGKELKSKNTSTDTDNN